MLSRLIALLIGVLALASLRAQFDAMQVPTDQRLWLMAGYFTVLTNLIVAVAMFAVARGWQMPARVAAGLVVAIVMVGLIYHLILARLWAPQGLAWWANQGLHTAVPLTMAGWWLAFAAKDVGWRDVPAWLIWPAVYGVYAVVRGALTGFWAYPFVDADALGWGQVAVNIAGLLVAFAVLGAGVLGGSRWLSKAGVQG